MRLAQITSQLEKPHLSTKQAASLQVRQAAQQQNLRRQQAKVHTQSEGLLPGLVAIAVFGAMASPSGKAVLPSVIGESARTTAMLGLTATALGTTMSGLGRMYGWGDGSMIKGARQIALGMFGPTLVAKVLGLTAGGDQAVTYEKRYYRQHGFA
jgi:hypothetical protein